MSVRWRLIAVMVILAAAVSGLLYGLQTGPIEPVGVSPAVAEVAPPMAPKPVERQGGGGELTTQNCDRQETSFGDLAADGLCADANVTIGLIPAVSFKLGSIRADNPTREEIAGLLQTPEETWAVSSLTGDQIRRALERSLSRLPQPNTAFLQVSGLTVVYDESRTREQRIVSLTSSQGPVQANQRYEVVMPLFLAQGGSGYFQIFDKDSIIRRGSRGLADAVYVFRQANPARTYTGQGRIVPAG